jgi:hypothetical protein
VPLERPDLGGVGPLTSPFQSALLIPTGRNDRGCRLFPVRRAWLGTGAWSGSAAACRSSAATSCRPSTVNHDAPAPRRHHDQPDTAVLGTMGSRSKASAARLTVPVRPRSAACLRAFQIVSTGRADAHVSRPWWTRPTAGGGVRGDSGSVARALFADCHAELLRSLHAGSGGEGADCHRRDPGGPEGVKRPWKLPRACGRGIA